MSSPYIHFIMTSLFEVTGDIKVKKPISIDIVFIIFKSIGLVNIKVRSRSAEPHVKKEVSLMKGFDDEITVKNADHGEDEAVSNIIDTHQHDDIEADKSSTNKCGHLVETTK
ncbi:hypothetical protein CHS0354_016418 [Potamilus streckersoni]|uniref:Uncharacterized protein n=1 Tax=Potamilus streckersoni TaxID=2493646 RepID=A0AAE0SUZ4_9BIVA|nr:hypothetical protein CHS0354_016418 [Potamilus streckersoni]